MLMFSGFAAVAIPHAAFAQGGVNCDDSNLTISGGADCAKGANTPDKLNGDGGAFTRVVNVMLFVVGAVAVIMLIVGGIRYVVSNGDQGAVTAAKNTILYAIIGIIVAILAYAIVNFFVSSFTQQT